MKIYLTKFKVFTSISRKESVEVNVKDEIVDALYKNVNGMVAHALTHKLYDADGEVELADEEFKILDSLMVHSTVRMIDSWNYYKENNIS